MRAIHKKGNQMSESQTPVLDDFAKRVQTRGRYGFDWSVIVAIVLQILQQCMDDRDRLQAAAEGQVSRSQMAALRILARREVRGEVPFLLAWSIGNQLANDIVAELQDSSAVGDGPGDIYQTALEEVGFLVG